MTVTYLINTLNRMLKDAVILPDSEVVLRTAGEIAPKMEITIEKPVTMISCTETTPGKPILKIIGTD